MKKVLLAIAVLALVAGRASADMVLLSDNFDGYANQAAFNGNWGLVSPQPSGTLSTAQAVSAPNSIRNVGTTVAADAQRNQRSFTESGVPAGSDVNMIRFSFDFYDSNAGVAPSRNHTNLQDGASPTLSGQLVSMGLNNNLGSQMDGGNYYMARILGYTPTFAPPTGGPANPTPTSGAFFKLNNLPGAPLRSTGWHNLRVDITNTSFSFYVDGILSEVVSNTFTLRSYDVVRLGSGLSNGGVETYWDNVLVMTIPEASSFAAMGLIGLISAGAVWIRKRRAG